MSKKNVVVKFQPEGIQGMEDIFLAWYAEFGDEAFRAFCDDRHVDVDLTEVNVLEGCIRHRVKK